MTENTTADTKAWAEATDTTRTILHVDGEQLPIVVQDVTRDDLEALDAELEGRDESEAADDVIERALEKYLVEPDVDPSRIPLRKRQVLWYGVQQAWSGAEEVRDAMEHIDVPGNR